MNSSNWRLVSLEEAKAHPLWGIQGWPIVFVAYLTLRTTLEIAGLASLGRIMAGLYYMTPSPTQYQSDRIIEVLYQDNLHGFYIVPIIAIISSVIINLILIAAILQKDKNLIAFTYFFVIANIILTIIVSENVFHFNNEVRSKYELPQIRGFAGPRLGGVLGSFILAGLGTFPWLIYVNMSERIRLNTRLMIRDTTHLVIKVNKAMDQIGERDLEGRRINSLPPAKEHSMYNRFKEYMVGEFAIFVKKNRALSIALSVVVLIITITTTIHFFEAARCSDRWSGTITRYRYFQCTVMHKGEYVTEELKLRLLNRR
jgi:hypothetical protein